MPMFMPWQQNLHLRLAGRGDSCADVMAIVWPCWPLPQLSDIVGHDEPELNSRTWQRDSGMAGSGWGALGELKHRWG